MPPAKRRKVAPTSDEQEIPPQQDGAGATEPSESVDLNQTDESQSAEQQIVPTSENTTADKNKERQERFKALQARAVSQPGNETIIQQHANAGFSKTPLSETSKKLPLNRSDWRLILIS